MTDLPLTSLQDESQRVPLLLSPIENPPNAPPIQRVPAVLLPVVILGFWFLPKRYGPRLAATRLRTAIVAALVSLSVALGVVSSALLRHDLGPIGWSFTPGESLRVPFASLVTMVHTIAGNRDGTFNILVTLGIAVPGVLLLVSILIMPIAAAGDRLGALFGKCFRLVLWTLTILLPISVIWFHWPRMLTVLVPSMQTEPEPFPFGLSCGPFERTATFVAIVFFILWWALLLLNAAWHSAGSTIRPACAPPTPHCHKCRYNLTGLSVTGHCPECNASVAKSLDLLRRRMRPTRWNCFKWALRLALTYERIDRPAK